jgi:hypothetical protein
MFLLPCLSVPESAAEKLSAMHFFPASWYTNQATMLHIYSFRPVLYTGRQHLVPSLYDPVPQPRRVMPAATDSTVKPHRRFCNTSFAAVSRRLPAAGVCPCLGD